MALANQMVFGPVPSRRLGRSLGINNIPPKICTYACIYCQLGNTIKLRSQRQNFYEPAEIFIAVREKINQAKKYKQKIDYLTFVPDGEPTLDARLGDTISLLKPLGIKTAVISNASLIEREDVRTDLSKADWVSFKIDAPEETLWRQVDRPHKKMCFKGILQGLLEFRQSFGGQFVTETMLIKNINDSLPAIRSMAGLIARLHPQIAYLSVPTRPPAIPLAQAPAEERLNIAYQEFAKRLDLVELLTGYEGDAFSFTGNARQDILGITSVHPMRKKAIEKLLKKAGAQWSLMEEMLDKNEIVPLQYQGHIYYLRQLRKQNP